MFIVSALAYYYAFGAVLALLALPVVLAGYAALGFGHGLVAAGRGASRLLDGVSGSGTRFVAWVTAPLKVDTTELEYATQRVEFAGDRFEYGGIATPKAARVIHSAHVAVDNSAEFYEGQRYEFR